MKISAFVIFLSLFVACGETTTDTSSSSKKDNSPYSAKSPNFNTGDINFKILSLVSGTQSDEARTLLGIALSDVSDYNYFMTGAPSGFGINTATGEITFTDKNASAGLFTDITLEANHKSGGDDITKTISIGVNGDPLREYAWHVENLGQKTFSLTSADDGQVGDDINLGPVFQSGITGAGVRIAISDSGVEINHDDLYDNALKGEHRDYSLKSPYIGDPIPTSSHGTAVAGIVNAVGWNNFGSIGIAPGAKFAAFQFLESLQSTSILVNQASGDFRVFNFSYGDSIYKDNISDSDYIDHLKHQTITNDKIFVKASGNEHLLEQDGICTSHNANYPYENESPFMIVVGALAAASSSPSNPSLIKASYSNAGSNLWVSAPGGERGQYEPAILTTDLPTCLRGYSKAVSGLVNNFEGGDLSQNSDCHYTSTMNGTSSAAPIVSGVVALLLEAEPLLKMRDVKNIFARTSVRVNPNHDNNYFGTDHPSAAFHPTYGCNSLALTGHTYELGWVENDAGYWFNNFYGFGIVDADAAVTLAKNYDFPMGTLVEQNSNFNVSKYSSGSISKNIPDANKDGVTDVITIGGADALTVESIQVRVNINHGQSGELGIELTSPHGTKSILTNINNSFLLLDKDKNGTIDGDSNLTNFVLTSNGFYGEDSQGAWTLKVIDGKSGTSGKLTKWDINILGHN